MVKQSVNYVSHDGGFSTKDYTFRRCVCLSLIYFLLLFQFSHWSLLRCYVSLDVGEDQHNILSIPHYGRYHITPWYHHTVPKKILGCGGCFCVVRNRGNGARPNQSTIVAKDNVELSLKKCCVQVRAPNVTEIFL